MTENPFLEIIDEKRQADSQAQNNESNPFLSIIDQQEQDRGTAFRAAMAEARDTDPDAYAKQTDLAKRTGIPVDVVTRNPAKVEQQAPFLSGEYDDLLQSHPNTVKFLSEGDNAKFAKDDISHLTVMEQIARMNDQKGLLDLFGRSFNSGFNSINVGIAQSPALLYNAYAALYNVAAIPQNAVARAVGRPDQQVQMGVAPDWLINNPVAQYYKKAAESYAPEELHQDPIELMKQGNGKQAARVIAAQVVANLPQQVFLVASTLAGQPEIGLAGMGALQASQATAQAQENGKSPLMTTLDALAQGSIEVATEQFGTVGIVKHWESALVKSFGKVTAKQVLADVGKTIAASFFGEGTEEFVAQIGQDFSDYATGNPNAYDAPNVTGVRDDGSPIEVTRTGGFGTAIQRAVNAFLIGGFSGGIVSAPTVLTSAAVKSVRASQDGKFWDQMMGTSTESKLRQRSPEKYERFVNGLLQETGKSTNIYISDEAVKQFFQNDQDAYNKFIDEMNLRDQLAEASNAGKEFEVSAAKFAAKYAGSPLSEALRPDIRFSADGVTQREQATAQQEYAKLVQEMQQEYATLVQEQKLPPEIESMRDKLILPKDVGGAGFSAEEADAQLSVFMAGLNSFARKAGIPLDQYVRKVNPVLNVGGEFINVNPVSNNPNELFQRRPIDFTDPKNVQYNEVIKAGGGEFIGVQPGFKKQSTGETTEGLVMFNDPSTNTTIALKPSQLTAEAVAARIAASRQQFQNQSGQQLLQQDDIEISPAALASVNWSKVNTFMKRKGYDFRGPEDAKEIFKNKIIKDGKLNASVFPDHAAALEYGSTKKVQSLNTKAKRTFGITPYFEEAGYLMQDGSLLDFSGRKDGYVGPPDRNVDHREIHRVYPDNAFPEDNVGTKNMIDFMNRGNIRLQSNGADISTANSLTTAQEQKLARHIQKNRGEYVVDFSDPKGNTVESKDYPLGTNPSVILNDIRNTLKANQAQAPNTLFQVDELGFFSKLRQTIEDKMPNSAPADQIEGILAGSGVKQDEMEWMGVKEFLAGKSKISKQEMIDFIEGNQLQLKEVTLGYQPKTEVAVQQQKQVIRDTEEIRRRIKKKAEELQDKDFQEAADEWFLDYQNDYVPPKSGVEELSIDSEDLDLTEEERNAYLKRLQTADVGQPDLFGAERKAVPAPGWKATFDGEDLGVFKTEAEAQDAYQEAYDQFYQDSQDSDYQEFRREWYNEHDLESYDEPAREELGLALDDSELGIDNATRELQPKFKNYILDNGTNYREVLLTLPRDPATRESRDETAQRVFGAPYAELSNDQKLELESKINKALTQDTFQSSHFNQPNIIAHFRLTERNTSLGRTLFIEEIQSDWHQQGRQKGYRKSFTQSRAALQQRLTDIENLGMIEREHGRDISSALKQEWADIKSFLDNKGVPDAPFKKTWHELASKRILRMAVEEGYDALAWTTGEQQVERYENALRNAVDLIRWKKTEKGVQLIGYKESKYITPSGNDVPGAPKSYDEVVNTTEKETALSDAIGKAMAEKILSDPAQEGEIQGQDIKISDTGMAGFYDRIIPQFLSKYTKKWGGKVGETEIDTKGVVEKPADSEGRKFLTEGDIKAKVHSLPITQEMRDSLLQGQPLFQGDAKPRGSVQFTDAATIINLYNSANVSTFLHETGHIFMREMQKLIDAGAADPQIVTDYETLKKFVGGNIESRAAQEKLARAFEVYLREGKAPSVKLVEAFRRFRDWLTNIYRSLRGLNVEINDDVRGVFDRILASEAEVQEAQDFYRARKSILDLVPLDEPQKQKLTKAKTESDQAALEKAVKERLNIYLRVQGGRQAIREQATKQTDLQPVYQAISEAVAKGGMNAEEIKAQFGKDAVEKLRNTHEGVAKYAEKGKNKKGSFDPAKAPTPAELAAKYGFGSPEDLVKAMLNAARRSEAITNLSRQILAQKEQELLRDLKGQENIAGEEAIHNDKSLTYLITEAEILAQRIAAAKNRRPDLIQEKLYRSVAKEVTGRKQVRQAIRYDLYSRAEQRFAKQAEAAILNGDFETALALKKKQLLNHALVVEAIKARDEKNQIENFFKAKNYRAKLSNTENDFAEAAMDLTSTYGLGTANLVPKQLDALKKVYDLDEMLAAQIPDWVLNKQKPGNFKDYRDLSFNQFVELADSIKSILQFGSNEMKAAEAGEMKTRQEWIDASKAIMETLKDRQDSKLNELRQDTRKTAKAVDLVDGFVGGATMIQFLSDWMDGFQFMNKGTFGPFRTLYNKVLTAETKYHDQREKVLKASKQAWDILGKASDRIHKEFGRNVEIQGVPVPEDLQRTNRKYWTVNRMIAILLNTGNAGNLEALQRGLGFTDSQIQKVASYFTAEELKSLQDIWEAADLLFPDLDAAHFDLYNRHLEKVVPQKITFTSSDGKQVELKGGYHPLIFDHQINERAGEHFEADMMKNQTQAVIRSSKPADGMTYSRKPGHSLPPLLDTSVWFTHINNTARYATYARILRDLNLITRDKEWVKEFKKRAGDDHYKALRTWLQYNANPTKKSYLNNLDRKSSWLADILRSTSTAAILGFKNAVGIKQRTSMINAAQAMGKESLSNGWKWILQAYRDIDWRTSALGVQNTKSWEDIKKQSPYMKSREGNIDREISDLRQNLDPLVNKITIGGKTFTAKDIQNFSFFWIMMNDRATVSIVWQAAYNQFIAEKADPKTAPADQNKAAIAYADGIVQDTQPSSLKAELSELQRSEGWLRLFTSFMTFTLKYGNRVMQNYRAWNQGTISNKEFFNHVLVEQIIQPYTAMAITVALTGGDLPKWWELLMEPFAALASWLPLVRDIFSYYKYGSEIGRTPLAEAPVRFAKAAQSTAKFVIGDKEFTQALWDIGRAVEVAYGVPVLNTVKEFSDAYKHLTD